MNIQNLKLHIQQHVKLKKIYLKGDTNHVHIIAVGEIFYNMKNIQRQKIIYQPLTSYIIQKKIHAVTIDTFTPEEWKKKQNDYTSIIADNI